MTTRDSLDVDIEHFLATTVVAPALGRQHRQHLRRKCFVELDEVDVAPANPGSREEPLDRGYRPHTHARGVAARRGPAREPARRLESEFGELVQIGRASCRERVCQYV